MEEGKSSRNVSSTIFQKCKILTLDTYIFLFTFICRYFKSQWGFPLRKDLEFNDIINYSIMKMKDAGIHDSIMRRYDGEDGEARKCGQRAKGSALSLLGTISFFIILSVGIILSILFLMLEIFWRAFLCGKMKKSAW